MHLVNQHILSQAAIAFGMNPTSLEFVSNSTNEVYRYIKDNQIYYLRLSEKSIEYEMSIQAEVHWVRFLAMNGVRVSIPVSTIEGSMTAVCSDDEKCYIATAFEGASGKFFDSDIQAWNSPLFKRWGATMGRMHELTSSLYEPKDSQHMRVKWSPLEINNPHLHIGKYAVLVSKLRAVEQELTLLPTNPEAYGLIHYDFHPYNFLIEHGEITVFDFDDSLYGWYAMDIGVAATHAVWWGSDHPKWCSKNEFSKYFLTSFLEGYLEENHLDYEWIKRIPLFMEYRNISSFFWWLKDWDGDEGKLTESQKNAITDAVALIQANKAFDGCDLQL
ncbi:Ser/Thr protein kinase RdoA (MazF antagonist) [Paenibacillus amylolyticus]|uniref:Ser/Thr protein kinase RdoA (MazF antagonist) n=1 Tax=Paenibacillus amylolyticus TaxID=1451 RepID=A0AAP5H782_PAEAM|nr:phosphotransferase [Paenibacillus amylolyticus]MDR6726341.1 Ser/Thr protein kinase RdoA (MazF antagonist) [Paenibacillus amylolyticus]